MCTVSAIPGNRLDPDLEADPAGHDLPLLRIVCNRDERRMRARALPPSTVAIGGHTALMPTDPDGGGSWIAANDSGLVFVLLNATNDRPTERSAVAAQQSRGQIVRSIAGVVTLNEARLAIQSLRPRDYFSFRLMAWSEREVLEIVPDRDAYRVAHGAFYSPMLRTSSSLGDARVNALRQALFERFLCQPLTPAAQDAFHRHRWPDRPEVSVFMSRPDARTVSITTIELYRDRVEMVYQDVDAPFNNCRTLRTAAPTAPVASVAL